MKYILKNNGKVHRTYLKNKEKKGLKMHEIKEDKKQGGPQIY